MSKIYIAPGKRTPFVKAGNEFASFESMDLSKPVIQSMVLQTQPDFVIWGQVIPDPAISNLSRELLLEIILLLPISQSNNDIWRLMCHIH